MIRTRVKAIRPQGCKHCGRMSEKQLNLFLPGRGGGLRGLGGLRLGHALLEFIDATGGVDESLLAGIEGMADVANADDNRRLGGAGFDHVAASATDFRFVVFRMDVSFHNKGRKK
jgi:hypothetical protein